MFPSCCSKASTDSGAKKSSVAKLLLGVFVVYMLHTAWLLYGFIYTKPCDEGRGENCITSYLTDTPRLQLSVFTCLMPDNSQLNLALKIDPFDPHSAFERQVNVSLPAETRANGSLFAVVYVHKCGVSPLEDSREVHYAAQLTTYIAPTHSEDQRDVHKRSGPRSENPVSHWRPQLSVTMMSEDFTFNKAGLPSDVRRYMRVSQSGHQMIYLPLLLVNELSVRVKDLMEINSSTAHLPLTVSYEGISLRRFRFWVHLQDVVYSLRQFGFTEQNIDEIKETLVGSNLYLLVLTALITALQLICEFLALKNDICSWAKKKSMAGMSRKSVLWRCLSTLLIFLYLLEETSLLVLLPVGLGACVEVFKVFKVFKLQCKLSKLHVNKLDDEERKTVDYDTQASRYLSYLVYPLCISGAIFSLGYLRQKSYYSWLINSLVTGVYAFGFLSMAPQLFINHKLRSVSHLQGTVLMYRGVNTLISDLCSCASFFSSSSGSFSSSHQLSCFRDELLFLIYLYQRSCYAHKARRRDSATHGKKIKTQ
ncbi:cleft lip and palate transmembrane 1 [Solea senegalensis]|uniref:Lipid scramblase CLPTM1L n=1 Tax=Solea senegalensis TaxID=28829 RepID=A0AAV6PU37_SOLSE|nr:cleft lip and palate transmembrane protein 1-like protein [Solea senegalensis]KAG7474827.1 cleft lip and palate transmembrane 1 [Solea senegalensis]